MTPRRIGVLGGTFDPIHRGHVDAGRAAAAALGLTRMYVVTSNMPPHRPQPAASSYHRFAMAAMAVAKIPGWRALDLELRAATQSYTTRTLKQFHDRGYLAFELFFVIGADAFLEVGSWLDYPDLLDQAHFAVVSRPGCSVEMLARRMPAVAARMAPPPIDARRQREPLIWLIDAATANVSSTAIRDRIAQGGSIARLVPHAVQQHIEQHGLYTSRTPDRRAVNAGSSIAAGRVHGQD